MRCYQQHSHGLSICGLPSFRTPPIPSSPSCRKAAPSTTGDLGERCKDPQQVQRRVPADNTFCVGASDPILSRLHGLRTPSRKQFVDILYMQFYTIYVCFSAIWWKLTINDGRKNIIGLSSNVACPDF